MALFNFTSTSSNQKDEMVTDIKYHEKIHIQTSTNILHIRSGGVNYANSFYLDGEYLIYGGT